MELSTLQKEIDEMTNIIKDGLSAQAFVADLNRQDRENDFLLGYQEDEYYTPSEPAEVSDTMVERANALMPTID